MKLFFDTETTGKADFNAPRDAPHQPYIVQLAALLTDDIGKEISSINLIINPGVCIPVEASLIHGITDAMAIKYGVATRDALLPFLLLQARAEEMIAHNISFDLKLLKIASYRAGLDYIAATNTYCTMHNSTKVCQIPNAGRGGYKWPKLSEAYRYAFGHDFEGAHNAMDDVRACAKLYFWLQEQK